MWVYEGPCITLLYYMYDIFRIKTLFKKEPEHSSEWGWKRTAESAIQAQEATTVDWQKQKLCFCYILILHGNMPADSKWHE